MKTAIVIGSGIAGLASSVRLAKKGYKVLIFEANDFIGGKINSKKIGEYRFDMGPSVFTCPEYIKELYDLCGKDFSTFENKKMPISFNYFYPDGQNFSLPNKKEDLINVLVNELGEDRQAVEKYLKKANKNYKLISPLFIETSLHRWKHLVNGKLIKALINLPNYRLNKTMNEENQSFFKNPKTIQLFNRFASYNGSNAFKAPAMLNMISHLELNDGVYMPKNGMVQIPQAVKELADELGVEFHLNEKVEKIIVENKTAVGIKTSKGDYKADLVFSNMDIAFTYEKLLPNEKRPEKILKQEPQLLSSVDQKGNTLLHTAVLSRKSKYIKITSGTR